MGGGGGGLRVAHRVAESKRVLCGSGKRKNASYQAEGCVEVTSSPERSTSRTRGANHTAPHAKQKPARVPFFPLKSDAAKRRSSAPEAVAGARRRVRPRSTHPRRQYEAAEDAQEGMYGGSSTSEEECTLERESTVRQTSEEAEREHDEPGQARAERVSAYTTAGENVGFAIETKVDSVIDAEEEGEGEGEEKEEEDDNAASLPQKRALRSSTRASLASPPQNTANFHEAMTRLLSVVCQCVV
jgi:hypothetical protein